VDHFIAGFLCLYTVAFGLLLLAMNIYYIYVIAIGMTSSERIKASRGVKISKGGEEGGYLRNFKRIFCTPTPKSTVNWELYR
jgi:hypothetical protein